MTASPGSSHRLARQIPVCEPLLDGNEERYLLQTVRTSWISSAGSFVPEFEALFAEKVGARYGVACSSGATALQLALETLGIGPGDEVVVPTFTMIASANAVAYAGAAPVLIDSEPETFNLDVAQLEAKLTSRTKAVMPVHVYGHPVDLDRVLELATARGIHVLSDAAEAHGAEYKAAQIGGLGDLAAYSFYANKIITTGEGGMITTNRGELAERARALRGHAFDARRHFWHEHLGHNFRMTNMQAAIGLAQTERFDELVGRRRRNAELYSEALAGIRGLTLPREQPWARSVFWMYAVLVEPEFGVSRDTVCVELAARGIETRTFFIPVHRQPVYRELGGERFPVAEMLSERGLYLPSAPTLTEAEIDYIGGALREIQAGR
jgi:perosamine synthetase